MRRSSSCFGCELPVITGESLSGALDPDGVVHYCREIPWYVVRGADWRRPDLARSSASLELEACEPENVVTSAAAYGVRAELVAPARGHGFLTFRYSGTLYALARWLHAAYDDGGGETGAELLLRLLELEAVPA